MPRSRPALLLSVLTGLSLLSASCQLVPALVGPEREGTVSVARNHTTLRIVGRTFHFEFDGDQPVSLMIGGHVVKVGKNGTTILPSQLIEEAKKQGSFLVLIPGHAPQRVQLDQAEETIALKPAESLGSVKVSMQGGEVPTSAPSTTLAFSGGLLTGPTTVGVDAYVPTLDAERQAQFETERTGLLKLVGGETACDDPWPCPPLDLALGLMLRADQPLDAGDLTVTYDLEAWLTVWNGEGEPPAGLSEIDVQRARTAKQILAVFEAMDPAQREALEQEYGIRLEGQKLVFPVELGGDAVKEGAVMVQVEGFGLLGVYLEVSVVSPAAETAGGLFTGPHALPVPGVDNTGGGAIASGGLGGTGGGATNGGGLISDHGGALIGDNGGGLIGDNGGGLISDKGGNILSNNAGNFISKTKLLGTFELPGFAAGAAKFHLLSYAEAPWVNASIQPVNAAGLAYALPVTTDAFGSYAVELTDMPELVIVRGRDTGPGRLFALAKLIEGGESHADGNAASTAITCWILDELRQGRATLSNIRYAGYLLDVTRAFNLLSQADASAVPGNSDATNAALIRSLFAANGFSPSWRAPGGTVLGTFATGSGPRALALDGAGNAWIVNNGDGTVTKLAPSGLALGTYAVGPGPTAIALDPSGNAWVTNYDGGGGTTVTKLSPSGATLGTYTVGVGPSGIAIDAAGNAWVESDGPDVVTKLSPSGATLGTYGVGLGPRSIAVDGGGNAWVVNYNSGAAGSVTKLSPSGTVLGTYSVGAGPRGIAIDGSGNAWVTLYGDLSGSGSTVVKLSPSGALLGTYGVGSGPSGLAFDADGNAWVANYGAGTVTELAPAGTVLGTYAVDARPWGVVVDGVGAVWVTNNGANSVIKLAP